LLIIDLIPNFVKVKYKEAINNKKKSKLLSHLIVRVFVNDYTVYIDHGETTKCYLLVPIIFLTKLMAIGPETMLCFYLVNKQQQHFRFTDKCGLCLQLSQIDFSLLLIFFCYLTTFRLPHGGILRKHTNPYLSTLYNIRLHISITKIDCDKFINHSLYQHFDFYWRV
ncbi:hypothetical protein ACJX0J_006932, partial [Zea mays]